MILTCPRCATRYLVDEGQVWIMGRTVQCDDCGQRWRAVGNGVPPVSPPPAPVPETEEFVSAEDEQPNFTPLEPLITPAPTPTGSQIRPWADEREAESLFVPPRPATRPRKARTDSARLLPLVIGCLTILFVVVMLIVALARREDVVRDFPALAAVYRAIGLPVGPDAIFDGRR